MVDLTQAHLKDLGRFVGFNWYSLQNKPLLRITERFMMTGENDGGDEKDVKTESV